MIIQLRNGKEYKGVSLFAYNKHGIELVDKNDRTVVKFHFKDFCSVSNNKKTESLTILDEVMKNGELGYVDHKDFSEYRFLEEYIVYDEHDNEVPLEREISFPLISHFDKFILDEYDKPYSPFVSFEF